MTQPLVWGWSEGGFKAHCWRLAAAQGRGYEALCKQSLHLWTTEKAPGNATGRCIRCQQLAAKEQQP